MKMMEFLKWQNNIVVHKHNSNAANICIVYYVPAIYLFISFLFHFCRK